MKYGRRRNGSRDGNQLDIVRGLEAVGCTVLELWDLPTTNRRRKGAPDILVGRARRLSVLMEIKNPATGGDVTDDQLEWHTWWRGVPVVVVRTLPEALRAVGI